ncbi:hypothetical protein Tco_1424902, partial [Tanacetum coccineum]
IQNQMLDYGYNFMQTKIHVDNESAICVVNNLVYHSKTKHIEITHHFLRDSYEKRLIEMVKIHTDNNVADLLTKAFDGRLMVYKCSGLYTSAIWIEVGRFSNTPEPQPTPSTAQPVFHEPQTKAHIEQLLPSPTTYQSKRKTQTRRRTKKDTKLSQTSVPQDLRVDEVVYKERGDSVERTITIAASLDAAQDSDNIIRTQTTTMPNVDIPQRMDTDTEPPTPHDLPLSGEEAKTAQDRVINRLKLRVKRLEKKRKARTPQPIKRRLFKGIVKTSTDTNSDFDVLDAEQITTTGPSHVSTADQVGTARPEMKEVKVKEKGVEFRNVEEATRHVRSITTLQPLPKIDPKDKAPTGREREREQFTIEERAQFLVETIAAQRKFRAAQRAAEIRSKPPTRTQLRNLMITYLKNTSGYKYSQLKGKTYEEIHGLYERQQKRNQDFIPMDIEVINDSGKKNVSSRKLGGGSRKKTITLPSLYVSTEGSFGVLHHNITTQA